jgi:hypothetical protein
MTPQSFSYGVVGSDGYIYLPPYGLNECLNYMLKLDPVTYDIKKIPLTVDSSYEKWVVSVVVGDKIYVLPYNESAVLIIDTKNNDVNTINLNLSGNGKYTSAHMYNNKIYALPFGIDSEFNQVLVFDTVTDTFCTVELAIPINNEKKWHTTQIIDNIIYGMPRGELADPYFPYRVEFNCDTLDYRLIDISDLWTDIDKQGYATAKYTTLAVYKDKLFAPPYCRNPNFDLMAMFANGQWSYTHTGQIATSRKYYTHVVAKNGKIYFPPAGHDEDWSELMIVNSETNQVTIKDLGIGKESKKYFAGCENSQGKIYYIPRGGCVCMPEDSWKEFGDLTEILVVDTSDDSTRTIDVSEHYKDSTTIEKYNNCVIVEDKIFALPYGESNGFQDILVFDTITEQVIKKINLDDL